MGAVRGVVVRARLPSQGVNSGHPRGHCLPGDHPVAIPLRALCNLLPRYVAFAACQGEIYRLVPAASSDVGTGSIMSAATRDLALYPPGLRYVRGTTGRGGIAPLRGMEFWELVTFPPLSSRVTLIDEHMMVSLGHKHCLPSVDTRRGHVVGDLAPEPRTSFLLLRPTWNRRVAPLGDCHFDVHAKAEATARM